MLVKLVDLLTNVILVFEVLISSSSHLLKFLLDYNSLVFNLVEAAIVILHLFDPLLIKHKVLLDVDSAVKGHFNC
jgi:hypothetical protein